ncbi:MAG: class I SAM-dependent methyltransferase [Tepidiformaceae bacterium]
MPLPRMYTDLAEWFHLLTAPEEYAEEAAIYADLLVSGERAPRTVLELGSGGGNNASHLKGRFEMTLVDLSPPMLDLSRGINPECEHFEGDMRTVRLGRQFDAVFVHDAIEYMVTATDLRATLSTAFAHCSPGGTAVFVPDFVRETFEAGMSSGGFDAPDGRAVRYLEWTEPPSPGATSYRADFAIMIRAADGSMRVEHDAHDCGVFALGEWTKWLEEVGFESVEFQQWVLSDETKVGTFTARRAANYPA